ncbi:MAG: dihydroorotate dehydrogenase electron transfer subunit, partial [Clostridiales bacterium]|nr:dihydroorotate dehydrogenase electron transfer subunit [Clostridiales bacterium]
MTLKKNRLCRIISNERLGADTLRLELAFGRGAAAARPGQFAHVRCAGLDAYMRRPFGIGSADASGGALPLFYQVKGRGTALLSQLEPGRELDVMAPLGNGFDLSAFEPPDSAACNAGARRWAPPAAAVIGGGTGIFPLLFLAQELRSRYGVRADVYLGFRDAGARLLEDEFSRCAGNLYIATNDGSVGVKGFATDPFLGLADRYGMVFACGPEPMLKTVQRICAERGLPAQISLEQRMACGIGACLGCACKVRAA